MTSIPRDELIDAFEEAIRTSGHDSVQASQGRGSPTRFLLMGPGLASVPVWVYIKNLTPADRKDPDEYRIQIKGEALPLASNPDGPTLLLGYYAASRLFVGFDAASLSTGARTQLSGGYVSLKVVKRAKRTGLSFDRDRRDRIAVGIRPDMLVPYCVHATEIHAAADDEGIVNVFRKAAEAFTAVDGLAISPDVGGLSFERQRLLRSIHVLARDAGFRSRVLKAYKRTCAISGMQLGLVEAAHILPVSIKGSNDHVQNGLSLLPQFHRAYDSGLIYLTPDYSVRVNPVRASQLLAQGLEKGLEKLQDSLGAIRLPRSRAHWPDRDLIVQANAARGIETI